MRFKGKVVLACLALLAGCRESVDENTAYWLGGNPSPDANPTPPTVTLQAPGAAAAEGTNLTLTVALSKTFNQTVTVPFTITRGTAGINDLAVVTTSPVSIPAGATSGSIIIQVVNDLFEEEPDVETLSVALGTPNVGSLGSTTSAALTITDNDSDGLDGTISGRVINAADGSGIDGVTVTGGGQTTTTAGGGRYSLAGVAAAPAIVVSYSKAGFAPQSKTTEGMIAADSAMILNIHMVPNGAATPATFDPTVAQVITIAGSTAQVALGANSLQTSGGLAPTGMVTARVTPLLPVNDVGTLPGIYRADIGGGSNSPRETFGGLDLSFVDGAGNALELAPLQTATVRIPRSTRSADAPLATLTAYSYDAVTGLWEAGGSLALGGTDPDLYYEGSVTRFGTYSTLAGYTTQTVSGCVVDPTGSPVPDATVVAEGIAYTGTTSVQTGPLGTFSIPAKQGALAFVQANKRTGISNAVSVTAPQTLTQCLLLVPGAAQIRLSWGEFPLDLDSHTMGPNRNSHTRWDGLGSLIALPFVALDVDDVTGFGPEITTIVKAGRNRSYRFMVQNFSQTFSPGQTGSAARVELYIKGEQTVFTPPPGESDGSSTPATPTWHVFDMQSDANCELTVVTPAAAPWQSLTEATLDDPANNPNADNSATFCN